jgi:hypothetical protein
MHNTWFQKALLTIQCVKVNICLHTLTLKSLHFENVSIYRICMNVTLHNDSFQKQHKQAVDTIILRGSN